MARLDQAGSRKVEACPTHHANRLARPDTSICSVPTTATWNNTARTIPFGNMSATVFIDTFDTAYIVDFAGNQVFKFLKGATNATVIANATEPTDIVVDTSGNVYIAQGPLPQILKLSTNGTLLTFTNVSGYGGSWGLAIDSSDNIYISDYDGNRVLKLSSTGSGNGTVVAGGNGAGNSSNQLNNPINIAVDSSGSLYILDAGNARIQKWLSGATTGTTLITGLLAAQSIRVDCNNYLYVTNGSNILRFPSNSTNGTAVISGLNFPTSVSFDSGVNIILIRDAYHDHPESTDWFRLMHQYSSTDDKIWM
ncbi:unnamed protein product [Didymodactylos carnosus]|uniref:NHL repeat containing protein n=1 Tax=Didymodactylos carnosus TaxID=1234261 RepID=A0A814AKF8_9BILA|nr:unnamed protein product [Didymodactylos carnosus]CAF0937886.1 unnamed protein product [Didymodactylos carnosus]CAF3695270.1 unnamed protein product [Didymodactylos carnosus]CAF3713422.1 unnamed protein product [Didymodactylos carnosus]